MSYSSNEGGSFVIVAIDKEGETIFDTSIRLQTIDDTATGMAVYMTVWLHDSMTAWQYGCMTVWMFDSTAAWQYGCMTVWMFDSTAA